MARGVVPQESDGDLQEARRPVRRTSALVVGHAGVLPRLQRRQWRPRTGIGFVRGVAMNRAPELEALRQRKSPLEMPPGEFREIGHRLVDHIADRLAILPDGLVAPDESPADVRRTLGAEHTLPQAG